MATSINSDNIYGIRHDVLVKQIGELVMRLMTHCGETGNYAYCVQLGWVDAWTFTCDRKRRDLCMLRIYTRAVKIWAKVAVTEDGLKIVDAGFVD
jgi:hypothetical protein